MLCTAMYKNTRRTWNCA